ncbi:CGP-CTERM sorting domain-containing protein [Thermococcus sp.]|uniref:CGP-CTERM sorting domain-containing protein n=1 Tax=Thermococcus sp. TaxID=35749 RepID=UPI00261B3DD4|nr:CGP-CTERM sorting domain-containing protein [Thermococcus sp.]
MTMKTSVLMLLVLSFSLSYVSALSINGIWVSKVYSGDNGAIIVVTNEILSPGMCPGDVFNCTLVPDMVSTDLFYVSEDDFYFLGEYPEDPNVTFEGGLWKLLLHTWNGSVENVTFNPACLKPSKAVPLNFSNLPVHWKRVVSGSSILEYPQDFLGFYSNSSGNYTVSIEDMMVKRIFPYFPFLIEVNGRLYPLYIIKNGTLTQVPLRVTPSLTCMTSTPTGSVNTPAKTSKVRHICGPGLIVLLTVFVLLIKRHS